ncbi:hypothetical protein ASPVEDRAFT_25627 [Aspergillus versicolor CBS 583.65]|uniref:Zn(2)-C6 fungal-type domain-containing protein n=1 Tax=Aspergillus versicolor CBS 583.65 TaxID=1036611 RepID=A0A1L9PB93_ASPVE|nr:uncharacterized protein ASPVEDRAFT_25627 [Aspergillus versicolor CBS 583.65]OJI98776.1 hypothetical protein ASPVEDRAFT_25627 [Aspergillus versicolor CBS 583.65]
MRPHTITTTTTPVKQPPRYGLAPKSSISDANLISRISKWLWSCRTTSTTTTDTSAKAGPTADVEHHEIRSSTSDHHAVENAFPCRACQAWGVECDQQKPRCSHCLDQQILCFYVEPLRVTMKRSKLERAQQKAVA